MHTANKEKEVQSFCLLIYMEELYNSTYHREVVCNRVQRPQRGLPSPPSLKLERL